MESQRTNPYKLIQAHQARESDHTPPYVYQSKRKNILIKPLDNYPQDYSKIRNDSALNLAAS